MSDDDAGSALTTALQRYLDARNSALITARRVLGVNEMDARALLYIAAHPDIRPSHLRDALGITSAGVTTLIDRLVERGVVRRDVDTEDRRASRLTLTVDLGALPWSALTRFDTQLAAAAALIDAAETQRFGVTLDELTVAASAA